MITTTVLLVALCAACSGDATPEATDGAAGVEAAAPGIEIEYIAHASFLLRAPDGTELLIDPYASQVWLGYDWPKSVEPDAILVTHPHYDHDAGRYREMPFPWGSEIPVMDSPGVQSFGEFTVTGVEGKHADPYGMEFGQLNTLMVIEAAGLRIAHLGDNGPLTPEMVAGLGRVDALMMPGDGAWHILSQETTQEIIETLQPKLVIPMHYRLGDLEVEADSPSDLGDVEPWLEGREGIERVGGHVTTLRAGELPAEQTFLVFEHTPYVTRPGGN
ncbi:MAG: MBL fold metallo-hydrolase [Longimicrobiales bacterium]|jgi:L-ascorbate metabolism protein UlaG (beta-lactamase superfamily)